MAQITMNLRVEYRPAFDALLACAREIGATHGDERAMAWAGSLLEADFDLFCRVTTDSRPTLRVIQGGR